MYSGEWARRRAVVVVMSSEPDRGGIGGREKEACSQACEAVAKGRSVGSSQTLSKGKAAGIRGMRRARCPVSV